jgi:translocation and assembly module TamB
VDRPTLDILALREIGEVKAGVQVTGTPRSPEVKLYSEPPMADTDILAYVVLGHPLGGDSGQAGLLMVAAGALLSKGESAVLQDRVKRRLGLDVLEIQPGEEDVGATVITVGKYLSPKLYVSLGHAFQTDTNEVRLRYSITDSWEVESNVGEESGADLYYKIEFQ